MDYVAKAKEIATKAHTGQERWGGEPYITHPEAVAKAVSHIGPEFEATAWLHDALEDTKTTDQQIFDAGIPGDVVNAVILLTHRPEQPYLDYILNLTEELHSRTHFQKSWYPCLDLGHVLSLAREVKKADLKHNLEASKGMKYKTSIRDKWMLSLWILENT